MVEKLLVGYELKTGKPVFIELTHMIVTGMTNRSGKTTFLEGATSRAEGQQFLVFRTKPDEQAFKAGHSITPFLSEESDWRYMKQLLESQERMKLRFETWHIMEASKGTKNLNDFYENCVALSETSKRTMDKQIFQVLAEYARTLMDDLKHVKFTRNFPQLQEEVNIMDLSEIQSDEIQSIIIRSSLDHVLHHARNVITIIPELWKFSPQGRNNPVKELLTALVRQGAARGNFVWADSQDMTGTDKGPLKQCYTWVLGLQTETNEAEHTLEQINLPKRSKPEAHDITSLALGEFFLSTPKECRKFYALPAGIPEEIGRRVALRKEKIETVQKLLENGLSSADKIGLTKVAEQLKGTAQETLEVLAEATEKQIRTRIEQETEKIENRLDTLQSQIQAIRDNANMAQITQSSPTVGKVSDSPSEVVVSRTTPRLTVVRNQPPLTVNTTTMIGQLGWIYADGFFKKPRSRKDVADEIKAKFGVEIVTKANARLQEQINQMIQWGFLQIEEGTANLCVEALPSEDARIIRKTVEDAVEQ